MQSFIEDQEGKIHGKALNELEYLIDVGQEAKEGLKMPKSQLGPFAGSIFYSAACEFMKPREGR